MLTAYKHTHHINTHTFILTQLPFNMSLCHSALITLYFCLFLCFYLSQSLIKPQSVIKPFLSADLLMEFSHERVNFVQDRGLGGEEPLIVISLKRNLSETRSTWFRQRVIWLFTSHRDHRKQQTYQQVRTENQSVVSNDDMNSKQRLLLD